MMIARRADTQARADVATWKMMAKLNGTDSLPPDAQAYLAGYQALLATTPESEATEATISLVYKNYYAAMGGSGGAPTIQSGPVDPVADNVTPFQRPKPQRSAPQRAKAPQSVNQGVGPDGKPRLPVGLIFIGLVIVVVGVRYFLGW